MSFSQNINKSQHTPVMYKKVLAFDIGIKNLAFCVLECPSLHIEACKNVIALSNCNLLEPAEVTACHNCKLKASFTVNQQNFCKRHIPKTHAVLKELSKKLPSNKVLKDLVKTHVHHETGQKIAHTNAACLEALSTRFAMPFEQAKQANASKVSLEIVHDALRTFVKEKWPVFKGCTHVLLENQPVFKNPHMKSVQVLLFATLREAFLQHGETPEYHFVHAKKKVADAPAGDEGYAERKTKSEERVKALFESNQIVNPVLFKAFQESKKKSDMADAVCMAVDSFVEKK